MYTALHYCLGAYTAQYYCPYEYARYTFLFIYTCMHPLLVWFESWCNCAAESPIPSWTSGPVDHPCDKPPLLTKAPLSLMTTHPILISLN